MTCSQGPNEVYINITSGSECSFTYEEKIRGKDTRFVLKTLAIIFLVNKRVLGILVSFSSENAYLKRGPGCNSRITFIFYVITNA